MKINFMIPLVIFLGIVMVIFGIIFFYQEKLIFFPEKLKANYLFDFSQRFEEMNIKMNDGVSLNGLLFKTENRKGLVFYLHGNAGSLRTWGEVGATYTGLGYDVFVLDYRGYGKSEGHIQSQEQMYADVQTVYDTLKNRYEENEIIILGYSMGTGPATMLAASNQPKLLILQAPYYSLTNLIKHYFPIFPSFLLKYHFKNFRYLENCNMPVVIFHGDKDEVIYPGSSLKLKEHFKKGDTLIFLKGHQHNGMTFNEEYRYKIKKLLD